MNSFEESIGLARSVGALGCLDAVLSEPDGAGSDLRCCACSIGWTRLQSIRLDDSEEVYIKLMRSDSIPRSAHDGAAARSKVRGRPRLEGDVAGASTEGQGELGLLKVFRSWPFNSLYFFTGDFTTLSRRP